MSEKEELPDKKSDRSTIKDHVCSDEVIRTTIGGVLVVIITAILFGLYGFFGLPDKVTDIKTSVDSLTTTVDAMKASLSAKATNERVDNLIRDDIKPLPTRTELESVRRELTAAIEKVGVDVRDASNADAVRRLEGRIDRLSERIDTKADKLALDELRADFGDFTRRQTGQAAFVRYGALGPMTIVKEIPDTYDWRMEDAPAIGAVNSVVVELAETFAGVSISAQLIDGGQACRMRLYNISPEMREKLNAEGVNAKAVILFAPSLQSPGG